MLFRSLLTLALRDLSEQMVQSDRGVTPSLLRNIGFLAFWEFAIIAIRFLAIEAVFRPPAQILEFAVDFELVGQSVGVAEVVARIRYILPILAVLLAEDVFVLVNHALVPEPLSPQILLQQPSH